MSASRLQLRILAVDPAHRGFGYVVLEGTSRLIDWGVAQARTEVNGACLARFTDLLRTYRPDVLVLENVDARACQRRLRVRSLLTSMVGIAGTAHVRVRRLTWRTVRDHLGDAEMSRYQFALNIARQFPEVGGRVPRLRKPWMSEDPRLRMFNAVALALACVSPARPQQIVRTVAHDHAA